MKNIDPKILKRFDDLCQKESYKVVEQIMDYENRHAYLITKKYGRFICQFDVSYSFLVDLNSLINYIDKSKWPKHRSIQWLLLNYNLKPIYSSFSRLIRGFYEDSLISIRPSYEALIKAIWISCYPTTPYSALIDQKDGSTKFNLTNFVKDQLKLDWSDYKILCAMAHSHWLSVLNHVKESLSPDKKQIVNMELKFNKELFTLGINYINFIIYTYLRIYTEIFITSTNKYLTEDTVHKANEFIVLWKESFLSNPKPYWPNVMSDVDKLFFMMKECDSGKNWKKVWESIKK